MPEERRRSFDRRKTLAGALCDELRGKYGVDVEAYLTAALTAESKAWSFIAGRGGDFRAFLPALLGRGYIASPSVMKELIRLVELGSDDRLLRACGEALARRTSGEMPVIEIRKETP